MREKLFLVLDNYKEKALKRKSDYNLLPRPLTEDEVAVLIKGLELEGLDQVEYTIFEKEKVSQILIRLLSEEVRRGTFPSSYVKAEGLAKIVKGQLVSPYLSQEEALKLLKEMKGGAAAVQLVKLLEDGVFVNEIIEILKNTVLVNKEDFERLIKMSSKIPEIKNLIRSWAERCFAADWKLPES